MNATSSFQSRSSCYAVALLAAIAVVVSIGWVLASFSSPQAYLEKVQPMAAEQDPLAVTLARVEAAVPQADHELKAPNPDPLEPTAQPLPPEGAKSDVDLASHIVEPERPLAAEFPSLPDTDRTSSVADSSDAGEGALDPVKPLAGEDRSRVLDSPLADGSVPPIVHKGATESLQLAYPRLEAVWVLDRSDDTQNGKPQTLMVWVFGPQADPDRPHFSNRQSGQVSLLFEPITGEYQSDQLILAGDPEKSQMEIWRQHRGLIVEQSGLGIDESPRLVWGWYRHRSEAVLLAPVVRAYRQAVAIGAIQPASGRNDILEVFWAVNERGAPYVAKSRLLAGGDDQLTTILELGSGQGS